MKQVWPDLPVAIKNGFAAHMGDALFTGLGSAGKRCFRLELGDIDAGWQEIAPFAGPAPSQPAAAVSGEKIYIFSGSGHEVPEAASPSIFDTVHCYDPASNKWETVPTRTPAGLLGASAVTRGDGAIALLGGFNKPLFDRYMSDISSIDKDSQPELWRDTQRAFMSMPPEAYQWNDRVLLYHPRGNDWSDIGRAPYLPNAGAAVIDLGNDTAAVIGGEVKPGLRTDMAKLVNLAGDGAVWQVLHPLPQSPEGIPHEGTAGAFCGKIGKRLILAGGTAFPGARAAAESGRWFAHEGLTKTWSRDVLALTDDGWQHIGHLPEGLAYGASFSLSEGLLIVGGEDEGGNARREVFLVALEAKG